ncbi:MAG TPA: DUF6328 family protein [Mycobacteriales bacterium]|nr:DUF6328 family protein [Mycobacteriales bacterium]
MADDTKESLKERDDRELIELLNGLRVALPGVQILFAFLLTVPFAQGFAKTTTFQHVAYLVCLLCATVSTGFFIAPAAQHRLLFRAHQKEELLRRANAYAVIGNAALIPALVGAVLLVVDFLFTRSEAYVTAGVVAVLLIWLWLAEPALRRGSGGSSS